MFSGIVERAGTIIDRKSGRLTVSTSLPFKKLSKGESLSVDGVCLTVHEALGHQITFRLLPETLRVSTLKFAKVGTQVNLERALRLSGRLGGHLLLGHIDGQGLIVERKRQGKSVTLKIKVPKNFSSFLVPKGPIGVDGVSLTLGRVQGDRAQVHLIAHTLSATMLGKKPVGARVNLELDLIAKYLRGMI